MTDMPQNTSTPDAEAATPVEARLEQILLEAEASLRSLREELEEQRRAGIWTESVDARDRRRTSETKETNEK